MVMSRRITCLRRLRTIEAHGARIGVVVHIQYDVLPLCSVPLTALGRSIRHACTQQSCCVDVLVFRTMPDYAINYNTILSVTSLLRHHRHCQC